MDTFYFNDLHDNMNRATYFEGIDTKTNSHIGISEKNKNTLLSFTSGTNNKEVPNPLRELALNNN